MEYYKNEYETNSEVSKGRREFQRKTKVVILTKINKNTRKVEAHRKYTFTEKIAYLTNLWFCSFRRESVSSKQTINTIEHDWKEGTGQEVEELLEESKTDRNCNEEHTRSERVRIDETEFYEIMEREFPNLYSSKQRIQATPQSLNNH